MISAILFWLASPLAIHRSRLISLHSLWTDRCSQPPVALMQWQNEINEYTDGKLRVLIYHNSNPKVKNLKVKDLRGFDVIMISYSGLESVYRKESKGWKRDDGLIKENSKIHAIHYHRLILDEAHNIKTRTTGGGHYRSAEDSSWLIHLQLLKLASHLGPIINGAFPVHLYRIVLESSFRFSASSRLRPLHAISARNANAQSYIGHRTKPRNVRLAITLVSTTSRSSTRSF